MDHAPAVSVPTLDATVFRRVIGNFMSGVVVITTSLDGQPYGMTVSAVSSLSLDPPMLLVCLNSASATQRAVRSSGRLAVNILAEDQATLAQRFAGQTGAADRFAEVAVSVGSTGVPVLDGALAVIECEVAEAVPGGTHLVFLCRVVHATSSEGAPLAYFRGAFGKLDARSAEVDAATYQRLRTMVLSRGFRPDDVLDVQALATELGVSPTSVFYAVTRLVADNLVIRDPVRGHLVRPLDVATSDDVHDAKLVLELGAADLGVGQLTGAELERFEELARATSDQIADGHFVQVDAYVDANAEFHRYPLHCTGIRSLLDAWDRLSLPETMTRALTTDTSVSPHLVHDHLDLVAAYRAGDPVRARSIIRAHTERAKATQRAAIRQQGGRA